MRALLALLATLPLVFPAGAQTAPRPAKVADLAFLAGHWASEEKGEISEETWSSPAGDSMVGMWRWVLEGKLKLYESMAIVEDADGPVLLLRHFDRNGVGWEEKTKPFRLKLVKGEGQSAVFEGPGTKGLLRLTYRREGDLLTCVVEKGEGREEFRMRRRG